MLPPPAVFKTFPNWVLALDEEGEESQDESTLKPADVQDCIGEFTHSTAADAMFPDDGMHPALLSGDFLISRYS